MLAVPKHVPGFPAVTADPAEAPSEVPVGQWSPEQLVPFRAVLAAGAAAAMLGPAPVAQLDPQPASTSRAVVQLLREDLGFTGLVVSDDLDAPATTMGRSVPDTALAAVDAGWTCSCWAAVTAWPRWRTHCTRERMRTHGSHDGCTTPPSGSARPQTARAPDPAPRHAREAVAVTVRRRAV